MEGVYRTTIALAPVVVSQPWPPSCLRSPPLRRSIQVGFSHSHDDFDHPGAHNTSNDGWHLPLHCGVQRACSLVSHAAPAQAVEPLVVGLEVASFLRLLEDPSPRQAIFKTHSQDMFCCFLGFPLTVMTHMGKTHCCGSHPLGPTVDRQVSVNSGVRYS